ncbi:unannotated protein [freshwater metagenome]|uniref:Unannotated protein n=1 Tax=freshwater metagenome TaxID=449393 RepID=A0A6J7JZJ5_9ZZZZ
MNIALHGCENDATFAAVVGLLHELFEMGNSGLHRFCRLQNKGKLHFACGEEFADDFHASKENIIDDEEGLKSLCAGTIKIFLKVFALTIDDSLAQDLFDGPVSAVFSHDLCCLNIGEDVKKLRERVVALASTVINEIEADCTLLVRNLIERHDSRCMHDRGIETGVHTLSKED